MQHRSANVDLAWINVLLGVTVASLPYLLRGTWFPETSPLKLLPFALLGLLPIALGVASLCWALARRMPVWINAASVVFASLLTVWMLAEVYSMRMDRSRLISCRSRLLWINGAIEDWSMAQEQNGVLITNGTPIDTNGMAKFMQGWFPVCPAAGRYSVSVIGEESTCTVHGTFSDYHLPDGTKPW